MLSYFLAVDVWFCERNNCGTIWNPVVVHGSGISRTSKFLSYFDDPVFRGGGFVMAYQISVITTMHFVFLFWQHLVDRFCVFAIKQLYYPLGFQIYYFISHYIFLQKEQVDSLQNYF